MEDKVKIKNLKLLFAFFYKFGRIVRSILALAYIQPDRTEFDYVLHVSLVRTYVCEPRSYQKREAG